MVAVASNYVDYLFTLGEDLQRRWTQFHSYWFRDKHTVLQYTDWQTTYHSSSFIACIHHVRKGQNAADPCRDIGSIVSIVVNVMELSDEFQLKTTIPRNLVPYLEIELQKAEIPICRGQYWSLMEAGCSFNWVTCCFDYEATRSISFNCAKSIVAAAN